MHKRTKFRKKQFWTTVSFRTKIISENQKEQYLNGTNSEPSRNSDEIEITRAAECLGCSREIVISTSILQD